MGKIEFTQTEVDQLLEQAKKEAGHGRARLAALLEDFAMKGVDLDTCISYNDLRAKRGLAPLSTKARCSP